MFDKTLVWGQWRQRPQEIFQNKTLRTRNNSLALEVLVNGLLNSIKRKQCFSLCENPSDRTKFIATLIPADVNRSRQLCFPACKPIYGMESRTSLNLSLASSIPVNTEKCNINEVRVALFLLKCASTKVNWFGAKHAICVPNPQGCFSFDQTMSDRPTATEASRVR